MRPTTRPTETRWFLFAKIFANANDTRPERSAWCGSRPTLAMALWDARKWALAPRLVHSHCSTHNIHLDGFTGAGRSNSD